MTCKLCLADPQPPYFGDPRKCAFDENGLFQSENWNCATMSWLRNSAQLTHRDDLCDESIAVLPIGDEDIGSGYIVMTYCKNRGQTGNARICLGSYPDEPLTIGLAEKLVDTLIASRNSSPHTEDCSFKPRDVFRCHKCGRVVCYCQGSDDAWPELCVDCWAKVEAK